MLGCRWCKRLSVGATAALRRKCELVVDDGLTTSPDCPALTPTCHYSERTPIAHVREKVTTLSGQPLYSEFFELRPKPAAAAAGPPSSSSPLHRCRRLESAPEAPSSSPGPAANALVRRDARPLHHHHADCVYGRVAAGGGGGFAATLASTGRGACRHHYRAVSPRRALSTDRLLTGKDVAAELAASSHGHGGDGAASPDLLPGSDLESLVSTSAH